MQSLELIDTAKTAYVSVECLITWLAQKRSAIRQRISADDRAIFDQARNDIVVIGLPPATLFAAQPAA